ncbi:MAG: class I SAM-dependent methyltransferase [Candidatus Paceibacterota bacterium]|jgi:SAM-dependent methyltransferase
MSSEHRFGYEWNKYSRISKNYENQFLNWTSPMAPADWKGKNLLDAGCGMGRNSYWPLLWGVESVIAFDYDERSVAKAKENLVQFKNAKIFYKNFFKIDWENEFDIAMSIGVIHHLEDPVLAIQNMIRSLKSGGTILIWVYSYEGNEWIVKYVNPMRKNITSKLPVPIVHFLSYFCSVPLYLFIKTFCGPSKYLKQLSDFPFWHIHSIVFDQLIPDIAHYWSKNDLVSLLEKVSGLENISINQPPNGSGWIIRATKK